MSPPARRLCHLLVAILATMLVAAGPANAASTVGPSGNDRARLDDLLKAARCQNFTNAFAAGYYQGVSVAAGGSQAIPMESWQFGDNAQWRPSGFGPEDLLEGESPRKGRAYRRYGNPSNAVSGTYNLTFVVMSNDDAVYICLQGTEPSIFPEGKPEGNTLNNLAAAPLADPRFDRTALVHFGWAEVARHYHQNVFRGILAEHQLKSRNKKLYLVGHSQGGALAGYLGYLLVKNGDLPRGPKHRLVILSGPRVGTTSFLGRFNRAIRDNAPNLTVDALEIEGDIVPVSWPMAASHLGELRLGKMSDLRSDWRDRGVHDSSNAGYLARRLIQTGGTYSPTTVISEIGQAVGVSCPAGYSVGVGVCVSNSCPSGFAKSGDSCVSPCPAGSRHSGTGNHCMTGTTKVQESTSKHWVGNFKPASAYRNACPSGTTFSHDLAGYTYCKRGGCPSSHPHRRGAVCHTTCGSLTRDVFGNCEVKRVARATRPLQ